MRHGKNKPLANLQNIVLLKFFASSTALTRICDRLLKVQGGRDLQSIRGQNDPPNIILGTNFFRCKKSDLKVMSISARKIFVFVQLLTDYLCIFLHFCAAFQHSKVSRNKGDGKRAKKYSKHLRLKI